MRWYILILLTLVFSNVSHAQEGDRIWILSAIPSDASDNFAKQLSQKLDPENKTGITSEAKYSMGYQDKLRDILAEATTNKVKCLICTDEFIAKEVSSAGIPTVIMGNVNPTDFPNAVSIIQIQPPLAEYTKALQAAGWTGGRLGLVMDKESHKAQEQCAEFKDLYEKAFGENSTTNIEIDSKTCAQLMDFVSAYNLLKSHDVNAVYLSEKGNVSRTIPFILNVAKKLKIPVLGGSEGAIRAGACLALAPDQDKLLNLLAAEAQSVLIDPTKRKVLPFRDFVMYHSPDVMKANGLAVPEDSGWKTVPAE